MSDDAEGAVDLAGIFTDAAPGEEDDEPDEEDLPLFGEDDDQDERAFYRGDASPPDAATQQHTEGVAGEEEAGEEEDGPGDVVLKQGRVCAGPMWVGAAFLLQGGEFFAPTWEASRRLLQDAGLSEAATWAAIGADAGGVKWRRLEDDEYDESFHEVLNATDLQANALDRDAPSIEPTTKYDVCSLWRTLACSKPLWQRCSPTQS